MEIWEKKKGKAERNQNGWGHNASWVIQKLLGIGRNVLK